MLQLFSNISSLFLYKFLFLAELLIAETIFAYKLRRRNFFLLRVVLVTITLFIITALIPVIEYKAYYLSLMFLVLFLFTLFGLKICFKESWSNILFVAIAGYTTQHLAYAIDLLLTNLLSIGDIVEIIAPNSPYLNQIATGKTNIIDIIVYFFSYLNVYFFAYNILAFQIKKNENMQIQNVMFILLSSILVLSDIVFNMISVFYSEPRSTSAYIECGYSIIICILTYTIQFSQLSKKKMEIDLENSKIMYNERLKQYQLTKENIDLINAKCHDLKHQIHTIRHSEFIDKNELKEIEQAISIYESIAKTGNEALDIILTEKSLLCKTNNINLSMLIDGSLLNFIEPRDIFTLFGNALDNSIESLKNVEEDKRDITIIVKQKGYMTTIHIENPYKGEILRENGKIISSKKNEKGYHGYGLTSIERIVNDYGGTMSIDISETSFAINIIFTQAKFDC